ncbi:MAG TPA: RIP metalloprotease RseP [Acholeplasmataceae bacterium]|jgi:regulator of sigma E protease|nr:RIP metalloprotease RseP [Acholeplasmataceae bacterium]
MDIVIGIIAFIFAIGLIILVHEGGHFFFARRANILCREFAFGMGPILLKKKKGETLYTLRAFPIGGFCAIAGEEYEDDPLSNKDTIRLEIKKGVIYKIYLDTECEVFSDIPEYKLINYDLYDEAQTGRLYMTIDDGNGPREVRVDSQALFVTEKMELQIAPYNRTLGSKTKRARAMVMFGGPLMNFILALVVFLLAGLIGGFANYNKAAYLSELSPESPAYIGGLRNGDRIIHMQSGLLEKDIDKWEDLSSFMDQYTLEYPTSNIIITYERDGKVSSVQAVVRPQVYIYSIGLVSDSTQDGVVVGKIDEKSKAYQFGLRQNDVINKVDGKEVTSWKDVYNAFINNEEGKVVTLTVNDNKEVKVKPYSKKIMNVQMSLSGEEIPMAKVALGVAPPHEFNILKSFVYSGKMTLSSATMVINTIGVLFTSDEVGVKDLSGPVGILTLTIDVAKIGFVSILSWIGLLSVNIGLLNLLPIPALDGGRLVFLGYEAITRKKPNPKVETALIGITMILLIALMIYVTFNDIISG